jgi:hypothetical protein
VLAVKYEDNGEPPRAGFNAPKIYRAQFVPPDPMDVLPASEPEYDEEPF